MDTTFTAKNFSNDTLNNTTQEAFDIRFLSNNWTQDGGFTGVKLGKSSVFYPENNQDITLITTLCYGVLWASDYESEEGFFLVEEEDYCPNQENSHYVDSGAFEITEEEAIEFLLK